jgi:hypothetical protein
MDNVETSERSNGNKMSAECLAFFGVLIGAWGGIANDVK